MPDVERLAAALVEARRSGQAVELNAELGALDGETAYAVQREGFRRWAGGAVAGYKIGWADATARAKHGVPEPIFGRFAPGDVLSGGSVHPLANKLKPGIEGELVFHLDRRLPGASLITVDHILGACSVGVGFDLMDSRLAGGASTWQAGVADDCGAGAVVLGPARTSLAEGGGRDLLGRVFLTLWQDGKQVDSGGVDKLGGEPAGLVAWLANKLIEQGEALQPGQFVFTGAMAGPQWLASAGRWEVRSGELGVARVEVTEGNRAAE